MSPVHRIPIGLDSPLSCPQSTPQLRHLLRAKRDRQHSCATPPVPPNKTTMAMSAHATAMALSTHATAIALSPFIEPYRTLPVLQSIPLTLDTSFRATARSTPALQSGANSSGATLLRVGAKPPPTDHTDPHRQWQSKPCPVRTRTHKVPIELTRTYCASHDANLWSTTPPSQSPPPRTRSSEAS